MIIDNIILAVQELATIKTLVLMAVGTVAGLIEAPYRASPSPWRSY